MKKIYLVFLAISNLYAQENYINLKHISLFIGEHVYTNEYAFQEQLRKNDLGLKKCMKFFNKSDSEKFFVNGWGQIIGGLIALKKNKISNDFNDIIYQNIGAAIEKGRRKNNPFVNVNVREQTKNIMMYPHQGKYLPWQKVNLTEPISLLNSLIKNYPVKISLFEGKCYLQLEEKNGKTIFYDLWRSNFEILLEKENYKGFKPNNEHPHITLVNSNIIALIKDKFDSKYASAGDYKFKAFIEAWINEANQELIKKNNPIKFVQLDSTYSEDYSPFEEAIVARLKAPCIKNILRLLVNNIKKEFDFDLPLKEEDSFHLTIATKYRNSNDFTSTEIEQVFKSFREEKYYDLLKFFEEFKMK